MANILQFSNLRSALLYAFELEGQISDGKYENSRPYDHWRWVCDTKIQVVPDGPEGTTRYIRKTYNLREWFKYMHDGQNEWARRIMSYARFGLMFESRPDLWDKVIDRCRYIAEGCPDVTYDGGLLTLAALQEGFDRWITRRKETISYYTEKNDPRYNGSIQCIKDEIDDLEELKETVTQKMVDAYNDLDYTEKSLKADHESMKRTVNTPLQF